MTYEKLDQLILYMRWMQENDLDIFTLVTSKKGFGKSSFSIQTSRRYMETFGLHCLECRHEWSYTGKAVESSGGRQVIIKADIMQLCPKCNKDNVKKITKFDIKKYLAYDNEDFRQMISDLPWGCPIIADEGVRMLMGEDWMKADSKELKKLVAQMRTKAFIVLANIPRFNWTDGKYRNDMTTFWVRILQRGLAVLMQPDLGEYMDPWHLKEFERLLGSYYYFTSEDEILKRAQRLVSKHPCAFDYLKFPPVPKELYEEYLILRDAKAFERPKGENQINQKDVAKIIIWNLRNRWEEFDAGIKAARQQKPTLKVIEGVLVNHPKTRSRIVSETTLIKWENDIQTVLDKGEIKPYSDETILKKEY